jgi:hypothetical protein
MNQPKQSGLRGWAAIFGGVLLVLATVIGVFLTGLGGAVGGAVIGLAMFGCFRFILYGRQKKALLANEVLEKDSRPPIIYLRPFDIDERIVEGRVGLLSRRRLSFQFRSYEEQLSRTLRPFGPFLAVGQPKENKPTLGAAKFYFDDESWKESIISLFGKARFVFLHIGTSENFLWELGEVVRRVEARKIILCLPMDKNCGAPDVAKYEAFRDATSEGFGTTLPVSIASSQFIYFDDDWSAYPYPPQIDVSSPSAYNQVSGVNSEQQQMLRKLQEKFRICRTPLFMRHPAILVFIALAILIAIVVYFD